MKAKSLIVCVAAALASTVALAADIQLDLTSRIRSIAVIGVAFGGHKAGNVEVEITGGFAAPLRCTDRTYLTTSGGADPEGWMLGMLEDRRARKILVTITDDAALEAFAGRCSIKAVGF